jgi:DNA gyrase/topoisomerase IV subunit A
MKKTREEYNAYMREWNSRNKERINEKARNKIRTDEQKASHLIASRKYHAKSLEKNKLYREQNREKLKITNQISREKNRKKILESKRKYYNANKEKIREKDKLKYLRRKPIIQKQNKNNREVINKKYLEYSKNKKASDPLFKLKRDFPKLIRISIKRCGFIKRSKTNEIIGCSYLELKKYLESKFEPWMNWNNHGKYNGELLFGWDIDHIIPISSAKTEEEVLKLNHYTNLQPLDSFVNRYVKRNKAA